MLSDQFPLLGHVVQRDYEPTGLSLNGISEIAFI